MESRTWIVRLRSSPRKRGPSVLIPRARLLDSRLRGNERREIGTRVNRNAFRASLQSVVSCRFRTQRRADPRVRIGADIFAAYIDIKFGVARIRRRAPRLRVGGDNLFLLGFRFLRVGRRVALKPGAAALALYRLCGRGRCDECGQSRGCQNFCHRCLLSCSINTVLRSLFRGSRKKPRRFRRGFLLGMDLLCFSRRGWNSS